MNALGPPTHLIGKILGRWKYSCLNMELLTIWTGVNILTCKCAAQFRLSYCQKFKSGNQKVHNLHASEYFTVLLLRLSKIFLLYIRICYMIYPPWSTIHTLLRYSCNLATLSASYAPSRPPWLWCIARSTSSRAYCTSTVKSWYCNDWCK